MISFSKKVSIVVILLTAVSFAQSAGNSGLSFLKFGFGARNIAMGDIGNVVSNDVTALHYNPAKLGLINSPQIFFMHNEWIQDVRSENIAANFTLFGLPLAVGFNTTTVSDIEIRTRPGEPDAKFNANFFWGSLSTGFEVFNDFYFGTSIKYLYEGMLANEATGLGFDFGILYNLPFEGFLVAASLKNIGSMSELRNEATKLPSELRAGGSYSMKIENLKSTITLGTEYQRYLPTDDNHFLFGGEFFYDETIALRAGYQTGYESRSITAGVGLKWGSLNFDYAFVPFNYNLGTGHLLSLSFSF